MAGLDTSKLVPVGGNQQPTSPLSVPTAAALDTSKLVIAGPRGAAKADDQFGDPLGQFGAGLVKGIPNAIEGLTDANTIGQRLTPGNPLAPLIGMVAPVIPGLKDSIVQPNAGREIKKGLSAIHANPDDYFREPETMPERIAEMGGEGLITSVLPGPLGKEKLISTAVDMGLGALSGASSQLAYEIAPEGWKEPASLLAGIAAPMGVAGALEGAKVGARKARDFVRPAVQTKGNMANMAGERLNALAGENRDAIMSGLENPTEVAPGVQSTAAQATGDFQLHRFQTALAKADPLFNEALHARLEEQNAARVAAVEDIAHSGSPTAVADHFRSRFADLTQMMDTLVAEKAAVAKKAAEGIDNPTAADVGRRAVDEIDGHIKDLNREANALWKAVDPDDTLNVVSGPIIRAKGRIYDNMTPEARSGLIPEERALAGIMDDYGPTLPFKRLRDLTTEVTTAMRGAAQTGKSGAYGRLKALRDGIEDAMSDSIAVRAAEEANGEIVGKPLAERFMEAAKQFQDEHAAKQATASGQPDAGAGVSPAAAAPAVSGDAGTAGAPAGGLGSPKSDQGLSQAALRDYAPGEVTAPPAGRATRPGEPDRYVGGLSIQQSAETQGRNFVPGDQDMAALESRLSTAAQKGATKGIVPQVKALSTEGRYGGVERSVDLEVKGPYYNPQPLWRSMLEEAKAADQDSVFLAKEIPGNRFDPTQHRPGIELSFANPVAREALDDELKRLAENGVEFLTVTVGGEPVTPGAMPNATGVRVLYMPEFDRRYGGAEGLDKLDDSALDSHMMGKADEMDDLVFNVSAKVPGVTGRVAWYSPDVAFSNEYGERLGGNLETGRPETPGGARGGKVWRGQSVREGLAAADRQVRFRAGDDQGVRGDAAAAPGAAAQAVTPVRDAMAQRLEGAGRPADEAAATAAISDAFYSTMAKRTGRSAEDVQKDFPLPEVARGEGQSNARGTIQFNKGGGALITLFKSADPSTALHEVSHHFMRVFQRFANSANAPAELVNDWHAVTAWFDKNGAAIGSEAGVPSKTVRDYIRGENVSQADATAISRAMNEHWARAFEVYARDGKAPSPALKGVFAQFKDWLTQVYKTITGMGVDVSPEIRGVFDRMLGGEASAAPTGGKPLRGPQDTGTLNQELLDEGSGGSDKAAKSILDDIITKHGGLDGIPLAVDNDRELYGLAKQYAKAIGKDPADIDGMGHFIQDEIDRRTRKAGDSFDYAGKLDEDGALAKRLTPHVWNTPEFKKWVGADPDDPYDYGHVITDDNGEPMEVYSGSPNATHHVFDPSRSSTGGFWFTPSKSTARSFTSGDYSDARFTPEGRKVGRGGLYRAYVKMENPHEVDWDHRMWNDGPESEYPSIYRFTHDDTSRPFPEELDQPFSSENEAQDAWEAYAKEERPRIEARYEIKDLSMPLFGEEKFRVVNHDDPKDFSDFTDREGADEELAFRKQQDEEYLDGFRVDEGETDYDADPDHLHTTDGEVRRAFENGHDGVIIRDVDEGNGPTDVYVLSDSRQIKSVYNRGTFDPDEPSILKQGDDAETASGEPVPKQRVLREQEASELRDLADKGDIAAIKRHPALMDVTSAMYGIKPTHERLDLSSAETMANRVYKAADGSDIKGLKGALDYLEDNARNLAANELGVKPYKVARQRKAVIVIGPPAAGKSTVANPLALELRAAIPDPDEAKKILPEYHGGVGSNATHEESALLSAAVLDAMAERGENMVIPKVGGKFKSIDNLTKQLQAHGYTVDVTLMDVPPAEAFRRMIGRYINSGRLIPPAYFDEIAPAPAKVFEQLKKEGTQNGIGRITSNKGALPRVSEAEFATGVGLKSGDEIAFASGQLRGPGGSGGAGVGGAEGRNAAPDLIDEGTRKSYATARAATKQKKEFERLPLIKKATKSPGTTYANDNRPEVIAADLWKPGAAGAATIAPVLEGMKGRPEFKRAVEDAAAASLHKAAMKDGVLDAKAYDKWKNAHADKLSMFPALDRKYETAAGAGRALEAAEKRAKDTIEQAQKTEAAKVMKLDADADVVGAVGTMLNGKGAVSKARSLMKDASGGAAAVEGLRAAAAQHFLARVMDTRGGIRTAQFMNYLGKITPALSEILSPEQMQSLHRIAHGLREAFKDTRAGPGSDTAQNLMDAVNFRTQKEPTVWNKMLSILAQTSVGAGVAAVFQQPLAAVAGYLGAHFLQKARLQGINTVEDLVRRAMLEPELMHDLMRKAPIRKGEGSAKVLARRLGKLTALSALQAQGRANGINVQH